MLRSHSANQDITSQLLLLYVFDKKSLKRVLVFWGNEKGFSQARPESPIEVIVCLPLWMSCFQFSVFLGLIFFLELTAGILAFVFKDWIKDQLNFFINNNVKAYRDDIDLQNLIDFAQEYVSLLILLCTVFFGL